MKMNSLETVIHIGYPKTGTTWFQKIFYPSIPNCYFLKRKELQNYITTPSIFDFDPVEARNNIEAKANGRRIVICDELLLGGLDIGFGCGEFIQLMANRLHAVFPKARIIIFIRNQVNMLESSYCQYLRSGGTYSLNRYLGLSDRYDIPFKTHHLLNMRFFEYADVINLYERIFGKTMVSAYLYEDFNMDRKNFIAKFCFIHGFGNTNVDVADNINVRYSAPSVKILRFLNFFNSGETYFKRFLFHVKGIGRIDRFLCNFFDKRCAKYSFDDKTKKSVTEYYRKSNNKLLIYFSRTKLVSHNYPLED